MRRSTTLAMTAFLAVAAAACGQSDDPDRTEGSDELRIYSIVPADTLDPVYSQASDQMQTFSLIYDPLINVDPSGELIPALAESWEGSDDALTLTLTLREGITFHNGDPIDAAAVKFNLDRVRNDPRSTVAGDLENVVSVEATADDTVVITQRSPDVSLPGRLSDRAGLIVAPSSVEDGTSETSPVGSGMYAVDSFRPNVGVELSRWDGYWDPDAVRVSSVSLTYAEERSTAENALRGGQADIIVGAPVAANADALRNDGFQIVTGDNLRFTYLHVNGSREVFSDPRVREALQIGVDREAIMSAVADDYGTPTSSPFPEGYIAYSEEAANRYDYDPDRAAQLLEEAGYGDGFSFTIVTAQLLASVAQAVQGELAKLGVEMQIEIRPPAQFVNDAYIRKEGDGAIANFGGRSDPSQVFSTFYGVDGLFNLAGTAPAELADAIAAARQETDPETRAQLLQRATELVVEEGSLVIVGSEQWITAASADVTGLESYLSAKVQVRGVSVQ